MGAGLVGRGGLINFPPLKRRGGLLERGGGLFDREGLIEDLRYLFFCFTGAAPLPPPGNTFTLINDIS